MSFLRLYLETSRPKTLIASVAPIAIVGVFHLKAALLNFSLYVSILSATILIQILTNYFNDYYDLIQKQDTCDRVGPKRPFQRGDLNQKDMKKSLLILSLIYVILTLPIIKRLGFFGFFISCLAYLLSIYYTKGNYSLAKLGLSDIFSFAFFGPLATGICGFALTGNLQAADFILGGATGALSTTLLVVNHLRDEEEDRKNQKTTTVVRFGPKFGKVLVYLFINLVRAIPILIFSMKLANVLAIMLIFVVSHIFVLQFQTCKTAQNYGEFLKLAALHFFIQTSLYLYLAWNSTIIS